LREQIRQNIFCGIKTDWEMWGIKYHY